MKKFGTEFDASSIQCCRFTDRETMRTIRDSDGEPRTATSTFTLLLSSVVC